MGGVHLQQFRENKTCTHPRAVDSWRWWVPVKTSNLVLWIKWNHIAYIQTHTHIYTHIFGITTSPATGLLGCQTLSCSHLTAELLFQTHPPSRQNTPSSISSHLFPSSAPQWAFMDHFHHTKAPLSTTGPFLKSWSAFFFPHGKSLMCGCF